MKKFLLGALLATASLLSIEAAPISKVAKKAKVQDVELKATQTSTIEMPYYVTGLYDTKQPIPNHYVILCTSPDGKYDKNTGTVSASNGIFLMLDLTNFLAQDGLVKPGTYISDVERAELPEDLRDPYYYSKEFTMAMIYENYQEKAAVQFSEPIVITEKDGVYDVTATLKQKGENEDDVDIIKFHFNGRMPITNVNEKESPYAQLKRNVDVTLDKGGIAFYQGVTDYSRQGVSYINVYSTNFDEDGRMAGDGWQLTMMVAHKRVVRKPQYKIFPGTYTMAKTLARDTWYPCRDIDMMMGDTQITTQFGSFIRVRETTMGQNGLETNYTYGYLADGTYELIDNGDGTYSGSFEGVTDLGYTVKAKFSGEIALNADNPQLPPVVSTLTDDVEMTFDGLKARSYHRGILGGCRNLTLDLGSRSGMDAVIAENGGGIIRLEFLVPQGTAVIKPGTYPVQELKWNSYELSIGAKYTPWTVNQFHWSASGGDMDGTVYLHFKEGSNLMIQDGHAPIIDGKVEVQTDDYENYIIDLDLDDDAGFKITGRYSGPIEYMYDRKALEDEVAGIESAIAEEEAIQAVVEQGSILILNGGNREVALYNINGVKVAEGTADETIDTTSLAKGVYILRIANKTLKIAL